MEFPADYLEALDALGVAFSGYEAETGAVAVLVGGAATALQTAGAFMSADFDVIAADDDAFARAMISAGFVAEGGVGHGAGGWYLPALPQYAVELVTGPLFDGRSDPKRLIRVVVRDDAAVVLPSVEDLIADRLAQHAVASASDDSRLLQARRLFMLAKRVDKDYLAQRIAEEGGDASLLGLS